MRKLATAFTLALLLAALGCVIRTEHKIDAHITLDIRHIQEQANEVLDFIEGKSDTLPGLGAPSTSWLRDLFDALDPMPSAYAAEELKTTSPLVTEIANSLRQRNATVEGLKKDGCIGEDNRGYVALQECAALSDAAKRNEVQKIVADENKDRKALYKEVARLNADQGATVTTIETVYATQRLKRAASGERVQLPASGPEFDEFKNSAAGKALGAACSPGAWVSIP